MVRGRTIELSGWIKTDQVTEGFADLYLEEYKDVNFNSFPVDTLNRGVRNSSGWTQIVIKNISTTILRMYYSAASLKGTVRLGSTIWN